LTAEEHRRIVACVLHQQTSIEQTIERLQLDVKTVRKW